jgi:hypothetical protein
MTQRESTKYPASGRTEYVIARRTPRFRVLLNPRRAATGAVASLSLYLVLGSAAALSQDAGSSTGNPRVDALLARMTLAEKLTPIHEGREDPRIYQGQAGYVGGVPRLAIPGLRFADGPPGVLTRRPSQAETATMGVAAAYDVNLAEQNGVVIGREARALGIDVSLQPFVNIDRDLNFRRAYNTFGEDPLLTSRVGAAEIRGIQSQPPADPDGEMMGDIYGGSIPEEPVELPATDVDRGATVEPQTIADALENGAVSEATVTRAAGRVLCAMDRFGFLDGSSKHVYADGRRVLAVGASSRDIRLRQIIDRHPVASP